MLISLIFSLQQHAAGHGDHHSTASETTDVTKYNMKLIEIKTRTVDCSGSYDNIDMTNHFLSVDCSKAIKSYEMYKSQINNDLDLIAKIDRKIDGKKRRERRFRKTY